MFKTILLSLICLLLSLTSFTLAAEYGGGSGTAEEPYEIWTAEQMNTIGLNSGDWGKHFKLMDNIDMSVYTGTQYNIIGNETTQFNGTFDGNGFSIRNLTYETTESIDYIGVFGYTSYATIIRNLGVENVSFSTGGSNVGGLVGQKDVYYYSTGGHISSCYVTGTVSGLSNVGGLVGNHNHRSGTISSCYAIGIVSGSSNVGGLVGRNVGTITSCNATGTVNGSSEVGGLVGTNFFTWMGGNNMVYGTIRYCYAIGDVNGNSVVGGLVGSNVGTVTSCYATVTVSATSEIVGGLIGLSDVYGTIRYCYANGSVSGSNFVGGLVGISYGGITYCHATGAVSGDDIVGGLVGGSAGPVTSCYATGSVSGSSGVGGICGYNYEGTIMSCYSSGAVSGSSGIGGSLGWNEGTLTSCYAIGTVSGSSDVGGLVGDNYGGTIYSSFWDTQTSGQNIGVGFGYATGVTGKTTAEMQALSTFTSADWDYIDTWTICEGTNYPRFQWQILPADFVCPDGVHFGDFAHLASWWMSNDCAQHQDCHFADLDQDGTVNILDLIKFADYWLQDR